MNSTSYLKIFLTVTLGFGALHVGSLLAFLYSPLSFYHGAGEYLHDIAYRVEGVPMRWEGMEYPDLARDTYFLYQYAEAITVTTDADGFRSRRYEAESYPVVISGDSTIFGSHLSDADTLPWKLAEAMAIPVFNGASASLSNVLAHPKLKGVEIFIDALTERAVFPRILNKRGRLKSISFEPLASKTLTMLEAAGEVPPQRYSLPLILLSNLRKIAGDFKVWRKGGEQPRLFIRHRFRPDELDKTVAMIGNRKREFDARGIRYVFMPIPAKQNIYAGDVDEYTRNFLPTLFERLRAEDIEFVDLDTPFRAHKDEDLFHAYDTHWNKKGTALAAKVIAEQLLGK